MHRMNYRLQAAICACAFLCVVQPSPSNKDDRLSGACVGFERFALSDLLCRLTTAGTDAAEHTQDGEHHTAWFRNGSRRSTGCDDNQSCPAAGFVQPIRGDQVDIQAVHDAVAIGVTQHAASVGEPVRGNRVDIQAVHDAVMVDVAGQGRTPVTSRRTSPGVDDRSM